MIIELMGQPASGKSLLIKSLISSLPDKKYCFVDYSYNKKNFVRKFCFLAKHIGFLDKNYFRCNKIIKQALKDRDSKMGHFFVRQFRLDYILCKYALRMSKKEVVCVFSENFFNLFAYIFFYNQSEIKQKLFEKLIFSIPVYLLKRDYIIHINVDANQNLIFKSSRLGKNVNEFEKETDFFHDFILVKNAQLTSLKHLSEYVDKIIQFENNYDSLSKDKFLAVFRSLGFERKII